MNEYCIEIKPKQGWMFDDDSFLGEVVNSKSLTDVKKCRYCYLQYLKVNKNHIINYNYIIKKSILSYKGPQLTVLATIARLIYFLGKA